MGLIPSRRPGRVGAFPIFLALIGMSGCAGGSATVKGKVYIDDKPLKGGTVSFVQEGKPPALAQIDEDGSYTALRVPTGKVKIAVETESLNKGNLADARKYEPPAGQKSPYGKRKGAEEAARYMPIPTSYNNESTSGLELEVKSGSNPYDIKLVSSAGGAGK